MDTEQTAPETTPEPTSAPVAETPPASMEDTIRETYRSLTSESDESQEAAPARARSPDGKFAKAAAESAPVETPAAAPAQPSPYDTYPQSWRKDFAETWGTLPPNVREEIHRREQNFLDGIKQYREPAAFGQSIGQELLPHVELFRQMNTTPQAVVRDLVQTWAGLAKGSPQERVNLLRQVAAQYGIDAASLSAPATGSASSATPASADLTPLSQEVAQIKARLEAEAQERARIENERVTAEIEQWSKQPNREHFADVRVAMGQLMQAGLASTLDEAYDKATQLVPEVRAKLEAARKAEQQKRDAAEAAAARKAAATNVTRRGTPPVVAKAGTMEDTIRATYRRLAAEG